MNVICVDGEERVVNDALALLKAQRAVDEAAGFTNAADALLWLKMNSADFALIGIELPETDGIELAKKLRELHPSLAIVFLTKDTKNAFRAYSAHPQAYLLKPLDEQALAREISYYLLTRSLRNVSHVEVQTFGSFELTVDGSAVSFKRSRAKELLALLVDRQGGGITRAQAFTEMWEDREYDRKAQKYFDVILHSLLQTLKEYGISEIVEVTGGFLRVRPELISCDRYRFTMGDTDAINAFQGVYLYGYSWANWGGAFYS